MITGYYKSVGWNSLAQFGGQAINLGVLLVLTTELSPGVFGTFAATLFIVALSGTLIEFGLLSGLIYQDSISRLQKTGAALLSSALLLVVWCGIGLGADVLSAWMKVEGAGQLAQLTLLGFALVPLSIGADAQIRKNNQYRQLAIANISSVLLSGMVAIGCVYSGYTTWALVAQFVVHNLTRSCLLFAQAPWVPKFGGLGAMFSTLRYSAKTTVSNAQTQLSESVDTLIVSRLFGADGLGIYAIALRLASYPLNKIKHIIGMILFPAFVSVRDSNAALMNQSVEVRLNSLCWVSPLFVAIAVFSAHIETLYFHGQWQGVGELISIMCVGFAIEMAFFGQPQLLQARGLLNQLNAAIAFQIVVFFMLAQALAPQFGLTAVAYALVLSRLGQCAYLAVVASRTLNLSPVRFMAPLARPFVTTLSLGLCGVVLWHMDISLSAFSVAFVLAATLVYAIQAYWFCRALPKAAISRYIVSVASALLRRGHGYE
ncbi:oligosaccharide flippase family protein [Litorivicinus lipolyticus]|uniref:oligosaccharide flippase family protein n=1 Tax=Litorivicinus lipolyticus TaxID=418701 RepID=UPI003B592CAD